MAKLRDGSEVRDRRLARMRKFDARSRDYPIRELIRAEKPRNRAWTCPKYLNQGEEGACVGFSITHGLLSTPAPSTRLGSSFATKKIYWAAQEADEWPGGSYPGAEPKYDGTAIIEGIKVAQRLGYFDEYRWAFGLDDLIMAVAYKGPAILGLSWYEGMDDAHSCGYLHVTGEVGGDHAILCKAVNVDERYFVLHNSWGPSWGRGGDARVAWEDMERLLHEQGEAVVPLHRHRKTTR
ncbi:hypothetical protein G6O69_29430 [Pseudenhygromyxa sp. WMMC2535]|uniref:hypothetical protein n=1 Tax=Pseudenhygromyxa sp. WMMC2535 TaxID=2712867 RepID=UPI001557EA4F|nr:hypothetical protein [Pseudenhygromyxa sp. WMMC2535]NVB41985.1 hypothetical protein [Pseudenhygromyxa sp. WMMC2535]